MKGIEEDWFLSREKMPEVDGYYYVYGFMHHECGNVVPFHKVVECRINQWVKSDVGEQMTYWRPLLEPPKHDHLSEKLESWFDKFQSKLKELGYTSPVSDKDWVDKYDDGISPEEAATELATEQPEAILVRPI